MQLLIVEDDASVARFLRQAVEEAGHIATVIADGALALERAKSQRFDLILLDVMLPGLSGFEVCRALRSYGSGVPILILTARDTVEDKVAGLDAGAGRPRVHGGRRGLRDLHGPRPGHPPSGRRQGGQAGAGSRAGGRPWPLTACSTT